MSKQDWLSIRAGREAYLHIQEHGLQADDISLLLGASGGPKWFILQGLDRYLFGSFFKHRQTPLDVLGTSAGAWRFASLGQLDPVAASAHFAELYRTQTYSAKPTVAEITYEAEKLLASYIPDAALQQLLQQDKFRHHFIVARAKGLAAAESKLQLLGLLGAASLNAVQRKWLKYSYERVLFHHPASDCGFTKHWQDFPTTQVPLSQTNFKAALLATGSIPMVLAGVRNIEGAPAGIYRDGGIIDYHFDVDLSQVDGLVLYPHFHQHVVPGWFDKSLKHRRMTGRRWPNVVMLTPSEHFIQQLPYGKIPDRTDFAKLDAPTRFKYWQQAIDQGRFMADQLHDWISTGAIKEKVKLWR